jgi:CheY-like chemotaxis protein
MARLRPILLVEDSLKDIELALAALKKNNFANEIVVARDGAEALHYLYRRGKFQSRADGLPIAILLD